MLPSLPGVNNTHLIWLVQHGYMPVPLIVKREIWDRGKADVLVNLMNFSQITYQLIIVANPSQVSDLAKSGQ